MRWFRLLVNEYPEPDYVLNAQRDILDIIYNELPEELKIGGVGIEVQIDESKFAKRKYHRGRPVGRDITWILGGIDSMGFWYAAPVIRHNSATLRQWIEACVRPGSIIV